MGKLTELPQALSFDEGDILVKDGTNGTKKIPVSEAAKYMGRDTIMINEQPTEGTKVVIETTDQDYELALMSDVDEVKARLMEEVYKAYPADATTEQATANFMDGADDVPMISVEVGINPVQSGSGDPSPNNIRAISGKTGMTVYHSGQDTSNPTTTSIDWTSEVGVVYGGFLDVVSGLLTVTRKKVSLTNVSSGTSGIDSYSDRTTFTRVEYRPLRNSKPLSDYICDKLKTISTNPNAEYQIGRGVSDTDSRCFLSFPAGWTQNDIIAWINTNHLDIVYYLSTPETYQLSPTEIKSILGENNIWSNTGNVSTEYRADISLYIQKMIDAR